jgi:membrane protein implicated in regulation of membrane protease activity
MTWWGWLIGGAILFGAELTLVSADFYLVFIGSAAILVGLGTALFSPAAWIQWAAFAALSVISMVMFRSRVYERLHRQVPAVRSGPKGGVLTLSAPLLPGESCQAEYAGTFWSVLNDTAAPIPSGTRVRITAVRDLTLLVRPDA